MVPNHIYGDIFGLGEYSQQQISACAASQSSSGRFSADIQANSQFFESNDNSEVKQIREDIYNTYNQKLSLPTIWENMPNNCQIYGLEPVYMVCNQIYGIWPNIWYMAICMVQKLPYIWIWPYHKKIRYDRPLDFWLFRLVAKEFS